MGVGGKEDTEVGILWGGGEVEGRIGTKKAGKSLQNEEVSGRSPKSTLGL